MRDARFSRRQPPRRRGPPAPARSDNGLYVAYALAVAESQRVSSVTKLRETHDLCHADGSMFDGTGEQKRQSIGIHPPYEGPDP
jgi:hypothetical protein